MFALHPPAEQKPPPWQPARPSPQHDHGERDADDLDELYVSLLSEFILCFISSSLLVIGALHAAQIAYPVLRALNITFVASVVVFASARASVNWRRGHLKSTLQRRFDAAASMQRQLKRQK
ncbi:hypothetical protein MKEN_00152200 [Mycena kentingensis (nom. inval.)]|nr:hypothetical protein MKEN_00152200 [Mycena kentingensis (nom. inval.)]